MIVLLRTISGSRRSSRRGGLCAAFRAQPRPGALLAVAGGVGEVPGAVAALMAIGRQLGWRRVALVQPAVTVLIEAVASRSRSRPTLAVADTAAAASPGVAAALPIALAVWLPWCRAVSR